MIINEELLKILICPESKGQLSVASNQLLENLNQQINAGTLKNRKEEILKQSLSSGLLSENGKYFYPIIDGIPVLIKEEAIAV